MKAAKLAIGFALGFAALSASLPARAGTCPPAGFTKEGLAAVKAAKWKINDAAARQLLAIALVDCLENPDSQLRDEFAYEGLQSMMRSGALERETLERLYARLTADLGDYDDPTGFRRPFDALVLAEVARVDRLQPFLTAEERHALVFRAFTYLTTVRDYRGFNEEEGWRHGVAHGADLILQLSLNPKVDEIDGEKLRTAIGSQVLASGGHVYRYGEPERLAAPIVYLARRGWWQAAEWEAFFMSLLAKLPKDALKSQNGWAARHNLAEFLSMLYVSVRERGAAVAEIEPVLLPGLRKALRELD